MADSQSAAAHFAARVDFGGGGLRNVSMRVVVACLSVLVSACASNAERIEDLARASHLTRTMFDAEGFRTLIYMKPNAAAADRLTIFLEGDGIPWRAGIVPSTDPTTARPVAMQLLIRTPGAGAYVTRPCYHALPSERCTPALWTNARYSAEVVDAMAATVREAVRLAGAREILLVGYSGGGTLALLIAERLTHVAGVVTLAANLDTQSWAERHGYLPLEGSLNPAASDREHRWPEIHLMGGQDTVVPLATTAAYFSRYPNAQRWPFPQHGHVCCWVDEWEGLWERMEEEMVTSDE
jgi:pimeloyl-ACP methyl ester carboxylesterase